MSCPKGKVMNRETGRCRKPCERHQARNPETGKCVTKNYLRRIQRKSHGRYDKLSSLTPYGRGSRNDYRDGLVPDPLCYPRKRNIHTGYCKTPCGHGRAINPATGNCVTLNYLLQLNPAFYDTDDDDEMTADILFTPTTLGTYENAVTKMDGFTNTMLTENDLAVMKAAYTHHPLAGVYSPKERKNCTPPKSSSSPWETSAKSSCGLTITEKAHINDSENNPAPALKQLICEGTDLKTDKYVFYTLSLFVIPSGLLKAIGEQAVVCPVKMLILTHHGVWRFLVPKPESEDEKRYLENSFNLISEVMNTYAAKGPFQPRKLANDVYEQIQNRNNIHVSFSPYPET